MFVSINWIKEFVNLDGIETNELVKRFNLATAEIENVKNVGSETHDVVLAKVLSVSSHPNSTKLHILTVDDGKSSPTQVVCGAPNVRVGMVTAFARIGASVNGVKIGPAKLAGVDSFGMCCSENELNIGSDNSGIMDITTNSPMGTDIKSIFPIDDTILEIDNKSLTNRPDLWGHYGLAREFSVIFKRELLPLKLDDLSKYKNLKPLNISVENNNCYRYSAISVDNITKKVSPIVMKIRLRYCGMRDINLLADITNYVMLELGQPMHAFDHEIVKGITVTEPKEPVKMTTLEHVDHIVAPGSVLICDEAKNPVAIAGIKGGLKSGISDKTSSLLVESATFNSVAIRKSAKACGLSTDASLRYEKSLDTELTTTAIARLMKILHEIDGGIAVSSSLTDVYNYHYPKHEIDLYYDFLLRRSGVDIPHEMVVDILKRLGFDVSEYSDHIHVVVPSFRGTKDVSIKEDLVEEVLRIYGYDNIVPKSLNFNLTPVRQSKDQVLEYKTKRLLAEKYGVSEVHTYLWNYSDFNSNHHINETSVVTLLDSSNSGQSGIRRRLAPSLIKVLSENKNNFDDVRLEEIGHVASSLDENNLVKDLRHLCVILSSISKTDEELYFEMKKIVENIAESLFQVKLVYGDGETSEYLHPINSCIIKCNGAKIGEMGILHPAVFEEEKHKTVVLELDYDLLSTSQEYKAERVGYSKYQTVSLDFNFVMPKEYKYSKIEEIINNFKCNYILTHSLKDIYENDSVLGNAKSYTLNFQLTPKDKTLTAKDIETFSARLISAFKNEGINLRV